MKRLCLLLLFLIALILCACGGETANPQDTTSPENILQQSDPREDKAMNILFVSNSTSYYFRDELYNMLKAGGYEDISLCLVYASGCSLQQHYEWWKTKQANYEFCVYDGTEQTYSQYDLERALQFRNWDIISFDNNSRSFASGVVETALGQTEPYVSVMYDYMKAQFPKTRFFWNEVWADGVGYSSSFVTIENVEQRSKIYEAKRGVAEHMGKTYGMEIVPTGAAWEKVRDLPLFRTPIEGTFVKEFTLFTRVHAGEVKDDHTHDGDMGGGQYLNACVWFEIITGKSCIGNTFRPEYKFANIDCSLTEEKIEALQNAAHEAVAALSK